MTVTQTTTIQTPQPLEFNDEYAYTALQKLLEASRLTPQQIATLPTPQLIHIMQCAIIVQMAAQQPNAFPHTCRKLRSLLPALQQNAPIHTPTDMWDSLLQQGWPFQEHKEPRSPIKPQSMTVTWPATQQAVDRMDQSLTHSPDIADTTPFQHADWDEVPPMGPLPGASPLRRAPSQHGAPGVTAYVRTLSKSRSTSCKGFTTETLRESLTNNPEPIPADESNSQPCEGKGFLSALAQLLPQLLRWHRFGCDSATAVAA